MPPMAWRISYTISCGYTPNVHSAQLDGATQRTGSLFVPMSESTTQALRAALHRGVVRIVLAVYAGELDIALIDSDRLSDPDSESCARTHTAGRLQ